MRFSSHPKADEELIEAATFFAEQGGRELARKFLQDVRRTERYISATPHGGKNILGDIQAWKLRTFHTQSFTVSLTTRASESWQ